MIELPQARELLAKAVETQGRDFRYSESSGSNCYYRARPDKFGADSPKGITGCLVGVALELAGETRQRDENDSNVTDLLANFPDMLSKETADYLQIAQKRQDDGDTWGEAFDLAEASVAEAAISA